MKMTKMAVCCAVALAGWPLLTAPGSGAAVAAVSTPAMAVANTNSQQSRVAGTGSGTNSTAAAHNSGAVAVGKGTNNPVAVTKPQQKPLGKMNSNTTRTNKSATVGTPGPTGRGKPPGVKPPAAGSQTLPPNTVVKPLPQGTRRGPFQIDPRVMGPQVSANPPAIGHATDGSQ